MSDDDEVTRRMRVPEREMRERFTSEADGDSADLRIYKLREQVATWRRRYLEIEGSIEDLAETYRRLGCGDVADKIQGLLPPHEERP